ncbi:hypothetical protein PILCRDRAFT_813913 [Piloderma croceum F 1598]|uniref:Uncharacterized protein n=1 Tax=Piloderma croceum (strain F 1598) TaxID=765440 RepID=A0A0C3GE48_PILCF|nr:hypothetical protein PILCRDRAFT_813913 [Piloderma croceum F 1598]
MALYSHGVVATPPNPISGTGSTSQDITPTEIASWFIFEINISCGQWDLDMLCDSVAQSDVVVLMMISQSLRM